MPPVLAFVIESSIVNSAPIFLAALVIAYIAGPFFKNAGANKYMRIAIYSAVGVAAGMWSYSSFDAPDRSIELTEAALLVIGMLIYSLLIIAPIVMIKNRAKS
ncbi:hypothetical protein ATG98_2191 [Marinobacter sp. LV10R520-4]|jgi:hypothetical protein|uniref:hypothetical protein n=1 Tax=Marinobacter sp. LV10R520-4 TaxID=1761796 RepID=UPI000BF8DE83|nr:hypothetical protein [Marinobacter sp. LV10R520-4]PFG53109.1 hypothetical protein ATG98_2191 [Marinobacter sp. LV10R520-4]